MRQEARWHVAQMLPRLGLTRAALVQSVELLLGYLEEESSIERSFAMQALADLVAQDDALRGRVMPDPGVSRGDRQPGMRSRGPKLVNQLGSGGSPRT